LAEPPAWRKGPVQRLITNLACDLDAKHPGLCVCRSEMKRILEGPVAFQVCVSVCAGLK